MGHPVIGFRVSMPIQHSMKLISPEHDQCKCRSHMAGATFPLLCTPQERSVREKVPCCVACKFLNCSPERYK